ncbi:hypothetical protein HCB27_02720 [Listeria booriae]|uniref:Uncharacterized protein n=1 Tax=Listeria booriae TaxID=1552123 RepID=A0A7X0Z488_9LIST|nr:hypothetical protein [Listeria booriae]MBC2175517.1 hypothetical protein [Listeria booriae]
MKSNKKKPQRTKQLQKYNRETQSEVGALKKELQHTKEKLEEQLHEEISTRADLIRLKKENEEINNQNQALTKEQQHLKTRHQALLAEKQQLEAQLRSETDLIHQIKQSNKELVENRTAFLDILINQKQLLEEISEEREAKRTTLQQKENDIRALVRERDYFKERYEKMMNTKMMKWTGKYWTIRKKIISHSK